MTRKIRLAALPAATLFQPGFRPARRNFLGRAGGIALAGTALWQMSSMAAAQPRDASLVLNASFPEGSGPGRFLTALSEQISSAGNARASWRQSAFSDMHSLADEPGRFLVLSNQELFPPEDESAALAAQMLSSLRPVAPLLVNPYFVVVSTKSRVKSVGELIQQARTNPGTVRYGSWQAGSLGEKYGAALAGATGTKMQHVAYPGLPALYEALGKGRVEWAFGTSIGPAAAAHREGLIRYLAIADSVRDPEIDVPTLAESGGPAGLYFGAWLGLYAGAQAQDDAVDQARQQVVAAAQSAALRETYPSMPSAADMTPERLSEYTRRELYAAQREQH